MPLPPSAQEKRAQALLQASLTSPNPVFSPDRPRVHPASRLEASQGGAGNKQLQGSSPVTANAKRRTVAKTQRAAAETRTQRGASASSPAKSKKSAAGPGNGMQARRQDRALRTQTQRANKAMGAAAGSRQAKPHASEPPPPTDPAAAPLPPARPPSPRKRRGNKAADESASPAGVDRAKGAVAVSPPESPASTDDAADSRVYAPLASPLGLRRAHPMAISPEGVRMPRAAAAAAAAGGRTAVGGLSGSPAVRASEPLAPPSAPAGLAPPNGAPIPGLPLEMASPRWDLEVAHGWGLPGAGVPSSSRMSASSAGRSSLGTTDGEALTQSQRVAYDDAERHYKAFMSPRGENGRGPPTGARGGGGGGVGVVVGGDGGGGDGGGDDDGVLDDASEPAVESSAAVRARRAPIATGPPTDGVPPAIGPDEYEEELMLLEREGALPAEMVRRRQRQREAHAAPATPATPAAQAAQVADALSRHLVTSNAAAVGGSGGGDAAMSGGGRGAVAAPASAAPDGGTPGGGSGYCPPLRSLLKKDGSRGGGGGGSSAMSATSSNRTSRVSFSYPLTDRSPRQAPPIHAARPFHVPDADGGRTEAMEAPHLLVQRAMQALRGAPISYMRNGNFNGWPPPRDPHDDNFNSRAASVASSLASRLSSLHSSEWTQTWTTAPMRPGNRGAVDGSAPHEVSAQPPPPHAVGRPGHGARNSQSGGGGGGGWPKVPLLSTGPIRGPPVVGLGAGARPIPPAVPLAGVSGGLSASGTALAAAGFAGGGAPADVPGGRAAPENIAGALNAAGVRGAGASGARRGR